MNIGTTQRDQVRAPHELCQRRAQPALGEDRVGVDIRYELALGLQTSGPPGLNKSLYGLINDSNVEVRRGDSARAVGAPIVHDDYLSATAGARRLRYYRGEA
jgi:hypothetical protein